MGRPRLEKTREAARKRDRVEAAVRIRMCAEPRRPGEKIEEQIARAARHLGWEIRRARAVWHQEARIEPWEMDLLRNCPPPPE